MTLFTLGPPSTSNHRYPRSWNRVHLNLIFVCGCHEHVAVCPQRTFEKTQKRNGRHRVQLILQIPNQLHFFTKIGEFLHGR